MKMLIVVPPELLPISPIEIRLDESYSPPQATFVCRLNRGSTEGLKLEWIFPDDQFNRVRLHAERETTVKEIF